MPDPKLGSIHHLAYLVDEIEGAAKRLNEQFGAGPFFYLDEVPVSDVTSRGEPAEYVHSAAFGICNEVPVELMVIAKLEPGRPAERFAGTSVPRLHHIGYALPASGVESIRAQLEADGLPEYLRAHFGEDVDFTFHDGSTSLGHDIELHVDSDGLRGFFATVEAGAAEWDGSSDLLRPALG